MPPFIVSCSSIPSFGASRRQLVRYASGVFTATVLLLAACGGGGGDSSASTASTSTESPVIPVLTATSSNVTVVLPAGVATTPDKLSVVTAIGSAAPSVAGAATLPVYVDGAQLAIVQSPSGSPMLMGWVDATHTTISAQTTAHVLAYFALDGALMLNDAERQALISEIPQANGITALESTVQTELANNVDAFAQPDAALSQAVAAFARPYFANAAAAAVAGRKRALDLSITPGTQSGIDLVQDPPFAAHLTNSYRRRAWAFVDRVSHTSGGVDVADPAPVTNFEVPPVIGVSGGVTGALTDIMSAYYGNQPTAYASITAPDSGSFAVPLVDGSDKTTYQVTVVGPGASAGVVGSLTTAQSTQLTEVAIRGFVKDFMVPTLANAVLGSGAIDFTAGQGTEKAAFFADVLTSATTDFIAFVPTVPGLQQKIVAGQWFDAGVDITSTVAGSNTLRSILVNAFKTAVEARKVAKLTPGVMDGFMKSFSTILNAAGGVLQVWDSGAYLKDLAHSDEADQWTIEVIATKVKVNPGASTIDIGGTVSLTASVLGVEDTAGYSYHWRTTSQFGDLSEVAGGSRIHQTDYCSSSNEAVFIYETHPAPGTVDTITVQAYAGSNCDPARGPLLGSGSATVTFQPNPWLGTWVGSTVSTCGFYSGPLTYVITAGSDPNALTISYSAGGSFSGGYTATYSGNAASGAGGRVSLQLNGNTMALVEGDSCQTGTLTKQ